RGFNNDLRRGEIRREDIIGRVERSLMSSGLGQMTASHIARLPFEDIQKAVRSFDRLNDTTTKLDISTLFDLQQQLIDIDREMDIVRQKRIALRDTPGAQDLTESENALAALRGMGTDIAGLFDRAGN